MIRGIYSAASAMDAAVQNHEVAAQNLAHATVPGYRQQGMAFSVADPAPGGSQAGTRVAAGSAEHPRTAVDPTAGSVIRQALARWRSRDGAIARTIDPLSRRRKGKRERDQHRSGQD